MNKAYSARLKSTTIEGFRGHLDSFPLSFFGKVRYGRCQKDAPLAESMFSQNTTCEVKESPSRFHYIFADVQRRDIVARVTAVRYRTDELSINLAWDEESSGLYMGNLIFSIKHFWKDAVIEPGSTQKSDAQGTESNEEKSKKPLGWDELTERENEVAHLLADGLGNTGIAEKLMITYGTAKDHCENISDKWGLRGSTDKKKLKAEAQRRGYGYQSGG